MSNKKEKAKGQDERSVGQSELMNGLTDAQCAEFRKLPVPFNDMVRAIYSAGATMERAHCWKAIDGMIKRGPIDGNGFDKAAQRNGIIMAANVVMQRQGS